MPNDRVIPTPQPSDLPSYEVLVNGSTVPELVQMLSIVVFKGVNKVPYAKLVIVDGDAASEDFPQSNADTFVPGNEIEIKAGYHQDNETIFKGIIVKQGIEILEGRMKKLRVDCRDKAYQLALTKKNNFYYEATDSDIAEEVAATYSLQTELEGTSITHETMVQHQVSDWDFLLKRAEANGQLLIADDGSLKMKKPNLSGSPLVELRYGATIHEFEGEIDARTQMSSVVATAWAQADQALAETDGAEPGLEEQGNLSASDLADASGYETRQLNSSAVMPQEEIQAWADAKLQRARLAKVRGRVKFLGLANIKPDTYVQLGGLGERFSGKAYVSSVRHEIKAGYWLMDAEIGLPEMLFENSAKQPETNSLVPVIDGLHIGVVTALQEDPQGENRIRVNIPTVLAESDGVWARVCTLDAGDSRGSFFLPEIEDEVIVGFLNNDPRSAVVLGMLNSSAKPAPADASDDNHEKGFVTRSGMRVWFNDDEVSMTLDTPNGNKIVLTDADGMIQMEDENGNTVTLDSNGIKMDSPGDIEINATGDVKINGTNVEIAASANFKADGGAGTDVTSSAITTVKGSLIQLN